MQNSRVRSRVLLGVLGVLLLAAAALAVAGCAGAGGGGPVGWLLGPANHPGPRAGGAGHGVPGLWGGLGSEIATTAGRIRWWFGLGGLACFGLGVYRAVRLDWVDAAKCLAAAIGLGVVGSIVAALFEPLAWLVLIAGAGFGVFLAVQWSRGRSVFGHSWACVVRVLARGRDRHEPAAPTEEVTP